MIAATKTTALAPSPESEDYTSGNLVIKDNAIQQPEIEPKVVPVPKVQSGRHSTRAEKQISAETLQAYLENIPKYGRSPLSPHSAQILKSRYWSTIIGICTIEQYGCTRAPYNNYWGIMKPGGGLQHFATLPDGITAIDALLARYEAKDKDTIEELNGYYVVPASANWFNTVLKTKQLIENL